MTCFLCGNDEGHHLGCPKGFMPDLSQEDAIKAGWLAAPQEPGPPAPDVVEILPEGSMTTVREVRTVEQCELEGCDNPKYSDHVRVKYCADHKDPKSRKE